MKDKIIYEVLRVIDGKPLFLENHLDRMKNSFRLIHEEFTLKYEYINEEIKKLIKSKNTMNGNIKLTYEVNEKALNVFFVEHFYPNEEMYEDGVKTMLYFGERENPNAKVINQSFREKVDKEIKENDAYEAILVDRNGYITEGSKSNIFMIKDGILLTSPVKAVLPGVTREEIINIAKQSCIEFKEVEYSYLDIDKLEGMFISGTSPKILPISSVGDIKMNVSNEVIRKLMGKYNDEIIKYLAIH